MAEDQDSKTEEPSSKRLEEAYNKGDFPFSREVNNFFILMILAFTIGSLSPSMSKQTVLLLSPFITEIDRLPTDELGLGKLLMSTVFSGLLIIALPVLSVIIAALSSKYLQSGMRISWEAMHFKWNKINPLAGLKRMFSSKSIVELIKSVFKLIIVGSVAYISVAPMLILMRQLPDSSILVMLTLMKKLATDLCIGVLIAIFFIALFDYAYQRFNFMKSLRMTKQEVKDEYKQQEGDPKIKGKIRQLRREKAMKRMMGEVPKSDVVITNPTHFAVALKYDSNEMKAPQVTAKGQDLIAHRIKQIAEENNVPVVENAPLARALFASTEIGEEIPTMHYEAVAKIISYVFGLKNKRV